jgi:hypothetical protein
LLKSLIMAVKKYLRKKKQKGEGRPAAQQFFQSAPAHDSGEGNSLSFIPPGQQDKVNVSKAGDSQEQEANRMADQVTRQTSKRTNIAEMSSAFGYDFSKVRIHTDQQAQDKAAALKAQAFTYGGEIFFNKGKFNTDTHEGQWLLAHELTHVMQQERGQQPYAVQKRDEPEISTPVPDALTSNHDKKGDLTSATGVVANVHVVVLPDTVGTVPAGKSAVTNISYNYRVPSASTKAGKVTGVNGSASLTITIQTVYKKDVNPAGQSAYGRGTTADDKKAGNTSLRFHEGSHGTFVFDYIAANAAPTFTGAAGQTVGDFNKAKQEFIAAASTYMTQLISSNETAVDCVGKKEASCP